MISWIALDVVPSGFGLIPVVLFLFAVLIIVMDGGALALLGMRPVGQAFVSSFVSNMGAFGGAIVGGAIGFEFGLGVIESLVMATAFAAATQAIIVQAMRANLSRPKAMVTTAVMKVVEGLIIGLLMLSSAF